jgi:CheY-like chemotaxis protein
MPGTDGYTFLRRVRAFSDADGGGIPAVALTAYTGEEQQRRTMLAGYQAHLGKPVNERELLQTVARLAGRAAVEAVQTPK